MSTASSRTRSTFVPSGPGYVSPVNVHVGGAVHLDPTHMVLPAAPPADVHANVGATYLRRQS